MSKNIFDDDALEDVDVDDVFKDESKDVSDDKVKKGKKPSKVKKKVSGSRIKSRSVSKRPDKNKKDFAKNKQNSKMSAPLIATIVFVVLIIVIIIGCVVYGKYKDTKMKNEIAQQKEEILDKQHQQKAKEKVKETIKKNPPPKVADFENSLPTQRDRPVVKVTRDDKTKGIASYKRFRTVSGDGFEFYWLTLNYKGHPYRASIDYEIYSHLEKEGSIVVSIHKITMEDKVTFVDSITVSDDYKSYLGKMDTFESSSSFGMED